MDDVIHKSVCFVSIDIYPLFNTSTAGVQGGSEVDFYMLATELAKDRQFRVNVITGNFGQAEVETSGNITIYKAADLQKGFVRGAIALWKSMCRADADIYFKKGASITTDIVALFCRLHHKIFLLRTGHDIDCDGTYLRQYPLRGKSYLWSLRQAKNVFVQKADDVPNIRRTAGISAIMIPNGHRITDLTNNKRDSVLWVGRSESFKQPQLFIKLAQENPSEKFVMICQRTKGDNKYDELMSAAKSIANLEFVESVPFHEIDSYFRRAKVFVSTSLAEGFANTFIQACKCGTPILSLKVNPDDFLNKYKCGLCAEGDWNKFRDMLSKLLEPQLAGQYSANAWRYVNENHNIEKIIGKYKEIFMQISNSSS
jgi:glycosyltransferase involved in cell wall biosynthesis